MEQNNIMNSTVSDGTTNTTTDDDPVVQQVLDDSNELIGYKCAKVLNANANQVKTHDLTFYVDLSFPIAKEDDAISFLQLSLIEYMSLKYGISTGTRCGEPPLDGSSWMVQFVSLPENIQRVDLFETCREMTFDDTTEECHVYEVTVSGSVLGSGSQQMTDVVTFLEELLGSEAFSIDAASTPYDVGFLSVAQTQMPQGDTAREDLDPPSSVQEAEAPAKDTNTITIVGGLLVAAFCCAFCGIILVLWRRRRHYLKSRDAPLTSKESDADEYDLEKKSDMEDDNDDLGDIDLRQGITASSSSGRGVGNNNNNNNNNNSAAMGNDSPSNNRVASSTDGEREEAFPNNITFDLGNSFKDQLMGLHGTNPPNSSRKLGAPPPHLQHVSPFASYAQSLASDSDADSWAQTEGTIGSLESHLEPITAEV